MADRAGPVGSCGHTPAGERQVRLLVGEGLADNNIARRLGIAEQPATTHLTSVFAALGVRDRVQAALWVERLGTTWKAPASPRGGRNRRVGVLRSA